jgi:hypothetical protein
MRRSGKDRIQEKLRNIEWGTDRLTDFSNSLKSRIYKIFQGMDWSKRYPFVTLLHFIPTDGNIVIDFNAVPISSVLQRLIV